MDLGWGKSSNSDVSFKQLSSQMEIEEEVNYFYYATRSGQVVVDLQVTREIQKTKFLNYERGYESF